MLFLAIGAGAIAQVLVQIAKQVAGSRSVAEFFAGAPAMAGLFAGFVGHVCHGDGGRMRPRLLIVAVASVVAGTFFLPVMAERAERGASRTILLVARDMAFYVDGAGEPNPDIRVRPGEKITLTLRNEDAGMTHDLAISRWNASTRELRGAGTDRITVTIPAKRGTTEYVCRPHSVVMRGSFVID